MSKEQYLLKLVELEQEINRLGKQIEAIDNQILELQIMQVGLQELEKNKEKEMLANLGRGIFIKTEISDKNLFVDVGNRTFIKKDIKETLKVIEHELEKLMEFKRTAIKRIEETQNKTEKTIVEAEKENL